ncbi:hypothetical protein NQZ68_033778 [Dissostichus eleginoides]|nr:hypothetical protein NQZ68_033778 [Dissostichus eleginoides]
MDTKEENLPKRVKFRLSVATDMLFGRPLASCGFGKYSLVKRPTMIFAIHCLGKRGIRPMRNTFGGDGLWRQAKAVELWRMGRKMAGPLWRMVGPRRRTACRTARRTARRTASRTACRTVRPFRRTTPVLSCQTVQSVTLLPFLPRNNKLCDKGSLKLPGGTPNVEAGMEESYETFEEELGPSTADPPPQKPVRQIRRPEMYAPRKIREEMAPFPQQPRSEPKILPREPSVPRTTSLHKPLSVQNLTHIEAPWENVTLNRCLFVVISILVLTSGFHRLHETLRGKRTAEEEEEEVGVILRRSGSLRHRGQPPEPETTLWEVMFWWLPDLDDEEDEEEDEDDDGLVKKGKSKKGASRGLRNKPLPDKKLMKPKEGKLKDRRVKKARVEEIKDMKTIDKKEEPEKTADEEEENEEVKPEKTKKLQEKKKNTQKG